MPKEYKKLDDCFFNSPDSNTQDLGLIIIADWHGIFLEISWGSLDQALEIRKKIPEDDNYNTNNIQSNIRNAPYESILHIIPCCISSVP